MRITGLAARLLVMIFLLLPCAHASAAESRSAAAQFKDARNGIASVRENLARIYVELSEYAKNAQARKDNDRVHDYQSLSDTVAETRNVLSVLYELLIIRTEMGCKSDESVVATYLKFDSDYSLKTLDDGLSTINAMLEATDNDAALVSSAENILTEFANARELILSNPKAFKP